MMLVSLYLIIDLLKINLLTIHIFSIIITMLLKNSSFLFILLFFTFLAFFIQTPQKFHQKINQLTIQFDMDAVTNELGKDFCNKSSSPFCINHFQESTKYYFSTENTYFYSLSFWRFKENYRYLDQLASGAIAATTDAEYTFLRQYNQWLIQISQVFNENNFLSPLNFNITSIMKSYLLSNSILHFFIHISILAICLFYLIRFYPLSIILLATIATLIFSVIVTCLYFSRPFNYIVASSTYSFVGLSLIIGTCYNHRISKIHLSFLSPPFTVIPLSALAFIIILLLLAFSFGESTQNQVSPQLSTLVIGIFFGLLIRFQYKPLSTEDIKHLIQLKNFDPQKWNIHYLRHHDQINYHQIISDSLLEMTIQEIISEQCKVIADITLPRFLRLIEIDQNKEYYLKELSKLSQHFDFTQLTSLSDSLWLNNLQTSNLLDPESEILKKIQMVLKNRNFQIYDKINIQASRLRRLLAFFIDFTILTLSINTISTYLHPFFTILVGKNFDLKNTEFISKILIFIIIYIPPLLLWHATLGKKILSIKIVSSNKNITLSWWQILGREFLGKPLSSALLLLGYMMILLPGRKTLHDHLFATSVVVDYNLDT